VESSDTDVVNQEGPEGFAKKNSGLKKIFGKLKAPVYKTIPLKKIERSLAIITSIIIRISVIILFCFVGIYIYKHCCPTKIQNQEKPLIA
jgi:hypothetical protein